LDVADIRIVPFLNANSCKISRADPLKLENIHLILSQ